MNSRRREALAALFFITPWIIGFLAFQAGPILASLYFSLTNYSIMGSYRFVGLRNFAIAFTQDRLFWKSLYNTLFYVGFWTSGCLTLGFVVAILLNRKMRAVGVYRTIYYLPMIVPWVGACIVWIWIFQPEYGLLNVFLRFLHLPQPLWLLSEEAAKPALVVMNWWAFGGMMIIFLAGLQGIPSSLYDAAKIDGAGPFACFWNITVPMMTPYIFFNLIIAIIRSFQVFVCAVIMTQGGPLNSTYFYMLHVYNNAFRYLRMGYASALSWLLLLIVLALTIVFLRSSRWWVHYK